MKDKLYNEIHVGDIVAYPEMNHADFYFYEVTALTAKRVKGKRIAKTSKFEVKDRILHPDCCLVLSSDQRYDLSCKDIHEKYS